jgi:uncharacterized protein with NAD-binding domain and iron-sulfur cluster
MAGLSAAWRLSEPDWRDRFDSITVYQRGWHLGGIDAYGRHVSVGGCPGGDIAGAAKDGGDEAAVDYSAPPCIAPDGTRYWTPDGDPC